MTRTEFYYNSSDGKTRIRAIKWSPEDEIKAVLQISHGMLEHMERYEEFANYMSKNGVLTLGNDHIGHGSSVLSEEYRGYFGEEDGNMVLIEDMHSLMSIIKSEYPDKPYFILGHSMGSFLTRQFITLYGNEVEGVVISGTGQQPLGLIKFGVFITKFIALFKGWNYRSKFVNYLSLGSNNNKFKPARTKFDWLTRDTNIVDNYISDFRINFIFTLNGFYHMFNGMLRMNEPKMLDNIPKALPIIFVSGSEDPVGQFGKDVTKAFNIYKNLNLSNVSMKLYDDYRHEILNELDREQVYEELFMWLNDLIYTKKLIHENS